ncbi:MAG TPA: agmatinase [Candidatus Krumholzibacterium sp.]|nr:agmatinase [Candidatus Krumholzibacterium sp.]
MKEFENRISEAGGTRIIIAGLPYDHNSSYMRGPADAPPLIRKALNSYSSNLFSENGTDLSGTGLLYDAGDLDGKPVGGSFDAIFRGVSAILGSGAAPMLLGGDHSVTWPAVRAVSGKYPGLNILHFDAHPDLYDELEGNRDSHACPFARIMEEGLAASLVQVGIRSANDHQRAQAKRFGVRLIEMTALRSGTGGAFPPPLEFDGPVYISFDMDALDPSFAPGVSHFEPGGLSTGEVITILQSVMAPRIVGADIVEYNPQRDPSEVTSYVCAKILKEIAALMLR